MVFNFNTISSCKRSKLIALSLTFSLSLTLSPTHNILDTHHIYIKPYDITNFYKTPSVIPRTSYAAASMASLDWMGPSRAS